MRNILLVDDDPHVLELYQEGLSHEGARVVTAADGMAAIQALRNTKPDVVVLDLMMPRFTGVDVLKYVRSQPNLKTLPVVVLSNSYMNQLAAEATALGVQKALLKVRCSPSVLLGIINDLLAGKTSSEDESHLLAVPDQTPAASPPPTRIGSPAPETPAPAPGEAPTVAATEFQTKARRSFLQGAPATCTAMRSLCQAFAAAAKDSERDQRLQDFYRKVHFIAATAGLAECHSLAQMASAFEALLFELISKPASVTPSVVRTIASTVDFLALLFDCARDADIEAPLSAQALVVDDDPLSNRLVVAALGRAQIRARSADDPLVGLQWLKETRYDLVLLDIEMPGMDGFELCRRLRTLPGYQKTPVIYVTSHSDFESRAKGILSGGNDLISKPVFPMELAVKAVALLLKRQMTAA
jgi:CheY-like chemotaxis protein